MMKKNVLLSAATITMLCFMFAGCASSSDNKPEEETNKEEKTEEKAEEEKSTEATGSSTKEMTEDIYVEILAQQMYLSDKYSKKAEDVSDTEAMKLTTELNEELNDIYQEHGVTEKDLNQFAEATKEDVETFGAIMKRVNERAKELKAEDE